MADQPDTENGASKPETELPSFATFLQSTPPNQIATVRDLLEHRVSSAGIVSYVLRYPEIRVNCSTCEGERYFRLGRQEDRVEPARWAFCFATYVCSNCRKESKTFALGAIQGSGDIGDCFKFGESPPFGPPTPARLISLIGPDRDLFLKGRRCETQGLGIGAFSYYRRVVENQKRRILGEIIRVAEKLSPGDAVIAELKEAQQETQFSKAVERVKHAIPQSLLIDGRNNPLTLLHGPLSEGLHGLTDEHCLALAQSVRVVLAELAERTAQALKDEKELKDAVSVLLGAKKAPT